MGVFSPILKSDISFLTLSFIQDGTIGDDLVIKPAPTNLKQLLKDEQLTGSTPPSHWSREWEGDEGDKDIVGEGEPELPVDYAFLGGIPFQNSQ